MARFKDDRVSDWKREQAIKLRYEQKMTYQQIGESMGLSKAYIALLLKDTLKTKNFHVITDEMVPYPRLADWMNENQVSLFELARRMGYAASPSNYSMLTHKFERGTLRKKDIDVLIEITGIGYEELFARVQ